MIATKPVDAHEFENMRQENTELKDRIQTLMQCLQESNLPAKQVKKLDSLKKDWKITDKP